MPSPLVTRGALPDTVTVSGAEVPIRSDFRVGVMFEELVGDEDATDVQKVALALDLWYPEPPADVAGAVDALLLFYRCGKPETDEGGGDALYSYSHDWDAIFSGFLAAYGIDLLDHDTDLHWWKFRSMLAALPKESHFMEIIGFRATDVQKDMTDEYKRYLRKMKRIYALPSKGHSKRITTEEEHDAALARIMEMKRDEE